MTGSPPRSEICQAASQKHSIWTTLYLVAGRRAGIMFIEVNAMENEDTVVLTPEEKEKILKEVPEDEKQEDEEEED